ncbi:hypothetical protein ACQ3I4_04090 [Zafaria sp. Z1313]|uniref:hypothetical protein n=1 Tax=unclassified Zafaria TaxID=2828765 RepID=UPI002E78CC9D|nr:hypothetical protein [Zafaria sp. J156]MEE1620785.1 hypothetical protein [Zafaria sp. J156]
MGNDTNDDARDAALKAHLHGAFDEQIPNFGSYNLVFGAGRSGGGGSFVVGYRRQPLELIVAPLQPRDLSPLDDAVSINLTNVSHLAEVREGGYEVGTTTGRVYRFDVADAPSVALPPAASPDGGSLVRLDQAADALDFRAFMDEFMTRLEDFSTEQEPAPAD